MTVGDRVKNDYFEWIYRMVVKTDGPPSISYRKLLMALHNTPFVYSIPMDENRASDGIDMRYRFTFEDDVDRYLNGPCSVLEMMVALAIRCEENIMDDPKKGDRTSHWFWTMVINMGLGAMTDLRFDKDYVTETVTRFLNRQYDYYGKGGLFTVKNPDRDMCKVEIWWQLCWYLNEIS